MSVVAMLVGGLVGALVVLHGSTLALVLPPLVLLAVCVSAGLSARSQARVDSRALVSGLE